MRKGLTTEQFIEDILCREVYPEYMLGKINASGGDGYGVVGLYGEEDIFAPGTISASGASDAIPLAQELLSNYYDSLYENAFLEIFSPLSYGSGILLGSEYGDIIMGNLSADMVLAGTCQGSIYQTESGLVKGKLLGLLAYGEIGSIPEVIEEYDSKSYDYGYDVDVCGPIKTDVDIVAAYSFGYGDIVIDEANDLQVGLVLPVTLHGSSDSSRDAFLGMAVAANSGDIFIRSQGDMLVNSVMAPYGGVFLQSEHGSIYAGKGWDPFEPIDLASGIFDFDYLSMLNDCVGYAPIVFTFADSDYAGTPYNLFAGGYSYISAPEGTIGVGTPDNKDPSISGEVAGMVWPPVEAVTGKRPSPGIDLSRYTPPGLVYFYDESRETLRESSIDDGGYYGNQIWPASITDPVKSGNPLLVYVDAYRTSGEDTCALPDWFVNSLPIVGAGDGYPGYTDFSNVAGLTLEMGPPLVPPQPNPINDSALLANALMKDLRAYYEIMNPTRFQSMVPATTMNFFGYHPLVLTDMAAFDDINLDAGAYDFISNSIKSKKNMAPYYGL